jgi:GNAT superfamily N-acetyltransferase
VFHLVSFANTRATGTAPVQFTKLMPGDIATVRAVFEGLSPQSRYLRFHAARSQLPLHMQRRLADVRPGSHQAHVAVLGNRAIGIARWIRDTVDSRDAELAIEVVDAAQSVGIGRQLAVHAARSARDAGVQCFLAYIDEANQDLRARTLACGATVDPHDPGLLRLPVCSLLEALEIPCPGSVGGPRYNWGVLARGSGKLGAREEKSWQPSPGPTTCKERTLSARTCVAQGLSGLTSPAW